MVDLAEAEACDPPGRRLRRAHGRGAARIGDRARCRPGGSRSELFAATVDIAGPAVGDGDIERVLAAGSRHSVRAGPRRAAFAADRLFARRRRAASAIRAACSAQRFGVDMHVVTADVAAARNLMLAVERCHLDVEAMVASALRGGPRRRSPTTRPISAPP